MELKEILLQSTVLVKELTEGMNLGGSDLQQAEEKRFIREYRGKLQGS